MSTITSSIGAFGVDGVHAIQSWTASGLAENARRSASMAIDGAVRDWRNAMSTTPKASMRRCLRKRGTGPTKFIQSTNCEGPFAIPFTQDRIRYEKRTVWRSKHSDAHTHIRIRTVTVNMQSPWSIAFNGLKQHFKAFSPSYTNVILRANEIYKRIKCGRSVIHLRCGTMRQHQRR